MNPTVLLRSFFLLVLFSAAAFGQTRPSVEFQLNKISRNLITPPQYTYTGAQQYQTNQRDRWLEVEVDFEEGITKTIDYFRGCIERGMFGERVALA